MHIDLRVRLVAEKDVFEVRIYGSSTHTHTSFRLSHKQKYVSLCNCVRLCVYWRACICMNQIVHVGMQRTTTMYGSSYVSIHIHMRTCMHACLHTYMYTYIQANMHTNMHTYLHTCIHSLHVPAQASQQQSADDAACGRVPGPHVASVSVRGLLLHATWAHACVCTCDG